MVIALPFTAIAEHIDINQKVHFLPDYFIALTSFATPAFDIKGKTAGIVTTQTCFGHSGEKLPYGGKQARISGRIAAWRTTNGALVNQYELIECIQARHKIGRASCRERIN